MITPIVIQTHLSYVTVVSIHHLHAASTGAVVGGANISGGGIAGILIGVIVGLVLLVLVVLIAVWMFRKYKKRTVSDYDFL